MGFEFESSIEVGCEGAETFATASELGTDTSSVT